MTTDQTLMATHTPKKSRTVLEARFDLYVRSLFQNPIRLKSGVSLRGRTEQWGRWWRRRRRKCSEEHGVREQQELNTHHICPCIPLDLRSGPAGAQHGVFDVTHQDWDRSPQRDVELLDVCAGLFRSDLISFLHAPYRDGWKSLLKQNSPHWRPCAGTLHRQQHRLWG